MRVRVGRQVGRLVGCSAEPNLAAKLDGRQGSAVEVPDEDYKCELRFDALGVVAHEELLV